MTEPDQHDVQQRSRVKVTTNAKGFDQPEISVVEGTTEEEMQRILDLALRSHEIAKRRLSMPPQS